ncbi:hypothetical protein PGTUg99_019444 [Puccinia graminis f. sp. tritici]|uniref:Uncharacterized protein n=1 Tax=Puccinia graminis f. sp. tritici TaxID=56615 RepID=A0A5B0RJ16_PUCGR|nr:hypothetical protein PGTUg99_019444 [Puccinia graminis f. sp. tritici]
MDALAVTPVCLRIAFAIDNSLGYIPLSVDDPTYIKEMEREKLEGASQKEDSSHPTASAQSPNGSLPGKEFPRSPCG